LSKKNFKKKNWGVKKKKKKKRGEKTESALQNKPVWLVLWSLVRAIFKHILFLIHIPISSLSLSLSLHTLTTQKLPQVGT